MSGEKWDLTRLTTGEYCALRRAAGTLDPGMEAWRAFYIACVGSVGRGKQEDQWLAAMCMQCLWRPEDEPVVLPFEECLRRYRLGNENVTESMKRRMDVLLDTPWSVDGFLLGKLYALARILRDKTIFRPDFEALADDLRSWDSQSRWVQRKWLRTIYSDYEKKDENKEDARDVD